MTWDEFVKTKKRDDVYYCWESTNIECPKCGSYIYKNKMEMLLSFPPKYEYRCFECDWEGTA